jgi:hypothetical protein
MMVEGGELGGLAVAIAVTCNTKHASLLCFVMIWLELDRDAGESRTLPRTRFASVDDIVLLFHHRKTHDSPSRGLDRF